MTTSVSFATSGLAAAIVGVIFLANAMSIRRPRRFILDFFGIEREQSLRTVLDQLRAKAEVFVGFLFLMAGFALLIVSELWRSAADAPLTPSNPMLAFVGHAVAVVAVAIVLRAGCRVWSLAAFRTLLARFFREHGEWRFDRHPAATREIGEILAIPQHEDDSIGEYSDRVREALKLDARPVRRAVGDDAFAPVRRVGADRRL